MLLHLLMSDQVLTFLFPTSECGGGPDAMMVLLAVVGSILLVGVVLLAVWKLVITIHDRREFARFQSARTRARYEMVRTIPLSSITVQFTVSVSTKLVLLIIARNHKQKTEIHSQMQKHITNNSNKDGQSCFISSSSISLLFLLPPHRISTLSSTE